MERKFSAIWSEQLSKALVAEAPDFYPMSLVGEEARACKAAVNQGIDAHLEACFVPARGDSYTGGERGFTAQEDSKFWRKGQRIVHTVTLECSVSRESLPVLVRRLMESGEEHAESLVSSICDTLGIELV